MQDASIDCELGFAKASVDSLVRQINDKFPGSTTTASRMLTSSTAVTDDASSPSALNSKPTEGL